MTPLEVELIVERVLERHSALLNHITNAIPMIGTREACAILKCNRRWLYENKDLFVYRIKNKRGDLEWKTSSLVDHKSRMTSS